MKIRTTIRRIRGSDWTFTVLTPKQYIKKHGDDSGAITLPNARHIDIREDELAPSTVRHELMHAYVKTTATASSDLDKDQMEELCAEIFGDYGPEICAIADEITNFFLLQED